MKDKNGEDRIMEEVLEELQQRVHLRVAEQFEFIHNVFGDYEPQLDSEAVVATLRQYLIDKK